MLDSYGRSFYQKVVVSNTLVFFKGYSPSLITLIGIAVGIGITPLLAFKFSFLALGLLVLSGFLDTLDGSLARYKNEVTSFGAALDIVGDRIVEFSVILGLYLFEPSERALPCIIMLGSVLICVTSFLVVGIFVQNESEKSFHYSPGLMERAEAFIFFAIMIILPQHFIWLAYVFSCLVIITGLYRLWQFRKFEH